MRSSNRRKVQKRLWAVLDPAFESLGWTRIGLLRWSQGELEAAIGFSRWNGMPPLPDRCRLDFWRGPLGWPRMALLTRVEQQPLRELIDDVRGRVATQGADAESVREMGPELFDQYTRPLPEALPSTDIELEYLNPDDAEARRPASPSCCRR